MSSNYGSSTEPASRRACCGETVRAYDLPNDMDGRNFEAETARQRAAHRAANVQNDSNIRREQKSGVQMATGDLSTTNGNHTVQLFSMSGKHIAVDWPTLQLTLHRTFTPGPTLTGAPAPLSSEGVVPRGPNFVRKTGTCQSDGYKWRKYGQKLLTGSKLYREYLRCTYPNCPAKKHVEISPSTGQVKTWSSTKHNHGPVLEIDRFELIPPPVEVPQHPAA